MSFALGTRAVMRFGITQARFNEIDLLFRSGDALFRLLLKSVQYVHHASETHGLNGPIGVAVEIVDQFQNRTAAESFQRLCSNRFISLLHSGSAPWPEIASGP